jgi:hypothetical protein
VTSCLSIKGKLSIVNLQWARQITESTQQLRVVFFFITENKARLESL